MSDKIIKQFKEKLEKILDEQFPKGKCKERGGALVLFSYANIYLNEALAQQKEELMGGVSSMRPNDVSAWAEYGKRMGYWDFFKEEVKKEIAEKARKEGYETGYAQANTDAGMPVSIIEEIKKEVKKEIADTLMKAYGLTVKDLPAFPKKETDLIKLIIAIGKEKQNKEEIEKEINKLSDQFFKEGTNYKNIFSNFDNFDKLQKEMNYLDEKIGALKALRALKKKLK